MTRFSPRTIKLPCRLADCQDRPQEAVRFEVASAEAVPVAEEARNEVAARAVPDSVPEAAWAGMGVGHPDSGHAVADPDGVLLFFAEDSRPMGWDDDHRVGAFLPDDHPVVLWLVVVRWIAVVQWKPNHRQAAREHCHPEVTSRLPSPLPCGKHHPHGVPDHWPVCCQEESVWSICC